MKTVYSILDSDTLSDSFEFTLSGLDYRPVKGDKICPGVFDQWDELSAAQKEEIEDYCLEVTCVMLCKNEVGSGVHLYAALHLR